jgi:hypothetical protein
MRSVWVTAALVGLGVAISVGVTLAHRAGTAPEVLPPVIAPVVREAVASPLPRVVERVVVREEPRVHVARLKAPDGPARLSVDCDVAANIYIDGQFARVTPMVGLELAPGQHVVRAESSASGLRLIPREETVMLKAGESRHLMMDLK